MEDQASEEIMMLPCVLTKAVTVEQSLCMDDKEVLEEVVA